MACKDDAARARRTCLRWEETQRLRCAEWRTRWTRRCDEWQTTQEQRCTRWREERERRCDRWEEERSRECESWFFLFRWLCTAWVWVSTLVCRVWTWVTTLVCEVWTWVTTTVCRLWTWVTTVFCALWVLVTVAVCRLWVIVIDSWCTLWCAIRRGLAPTEFSERKSECVFGWTSAYRADLDTRECVLTITLRIRLVAADGVSAEDLATVMERWEPAIESAWSGRFPILRTDGTCACEEYTARVDVQWVTSGEHHRVTVHPGSGRADMTNWYVNSTGGTAAHEAGHMFGNVDEYPEEDRCPDREVTNDGSIMRSSQTGTVRRRHYESFQRWVSNRTCCTYEAAERG